jgi:hypothetical protein
LKALTDDSKDLSYKQIRKIVKKLFIPIFKKDGYTIDTDSMRRHDYLEWWEECNFGIGRIGA